MVLAVAAVLGLAVGKRLGRRVVDARTGAVLCPIKPLDKAANADGQRRRLDPVGRDNYLGRRVASRMNVTRRLLSFRVPF